ncbi:MAG: hypothetical protein QFY14_02755 [Candidatus Phytoplasma pruni]|nr:hypothetical protein [Candidatus Phytoplasma pruni]
MPKPSPTDLEQIKLFLQTLKQDLIKPTIITHSKKKNTYQEANYRPKNQTLFVDPQILEEIKQTKITLINDNFFLVIVIKTITFIFNPS